LNTVKRSIKKLLLIGYIEKLNEEFIPFTTNKYRDTKMVSDISLIVKYINGSNLRNEINPNYQYMFNVPLIINKR
jgi:hypothetical protein